MSYAAGYGKRNARMHVTGLKSLMKLMECKCAYNNSKQDTDKGPVKRRKNKEHYSYCEEYSGNNTLLHSVSPALRPPNLLSLAV